MSKIDCLPTPRVTLLLCIIVMIVTDLAKAKPNQRSQSRIINGEVLGELEHPWAVIIITKAVNINDPNDNFNNFHCGASLIGLRAVLTAGHCLTEKEIMGQYEVKVDYIQLGSQNFYSYHNDVQYIEYSNGQGFKMIKWNDGTWINAGDDIGLMILANPVKTNPHVQPICLGVPHVEIGETVTIAGWGFKEDGRPGGDIRYFEGKTISYQDAQKFYTNRPTTEPAPPQKIYVFNPTKSTCSGDSGSAIYKFSDDNKPFIVGVVSGGHPYHCRNSPPTQTAGFHSRVEHYLMWIMKNIAGHSEGVCFGPKQGYFPHSK